MNQLTLQNVQHNLQVVYIPKTGPVETGVVKSWNHRYIFVNYFKDGQLQKTAQATDPKHLFINEN